jgi:hypothetical protein
MVKKILPFLILLVASTALAQPKSKVQFVNNCPDLGFTAIDIYVDGILMYDNLMFRTATTFDEIEAIPHTISIAPETSMSVADTFYSVNMIFTPVDTMVIVANGIESSSGYTPAPSFRLSVFANARVAAHNGANSDILIMNGGTDVAIVDLRTGIETIANNLDLGSFNTGYEELPFGTYTFRVTNTSGSDVIGTYSLPLNVLGPPGESAVLLSSGFLDPTSNSNGAPFEMMLVRSTGGAFLPLGVTDPEPYARLQFINNSADTLADSIDVYYGNTLIADDLRFRHATEFIDAEVGSLMPMGIAPANSTSSADAFYQLPAIIDSGKTYIAAANGIKSSGGYTPALPFAVAIFTGAREEAANASNVDILMMHGTTDLPISDIREGANTIIDDANFGIFKPYVSMAAGSNYIFTLTDQSGVGEIEKYKAQWLGSGLQGEAITLLLSGFKSPANNSNGPGYGLYYATVNGGPLVPLAISTSITNISNEDIFIFPNPANEVLNISGKSVPELVTITDMAGRTVLKKANTNKIDASDLSAGLYLIKIEVEGHTSTTRFSKH